jgi:4-amino-4-deoxy-L-arabinose transferase-like glycosyltransferase
VTPASRRLAAVALLLALGLALYLPGLGREVLRHPLEARYALAAREMLRGGPWLVAHLFGEIYPDKPPLYFWATAALGWLDGGRIAEATARLPAAAAAIAGVLLVARLGADLFGGRAGILAACVLATSNLFFWYARQGHPDQFLTVFVTAAGLGLWRTLARAGPREAWGWTGLAYAAMALGVLSKGLLGLVIPLLAAVVYAALTGPLRALPARLRLVPGLGIFLALVLAWYAPAVLRYGSGYFYETLVHQHMVRYARTWSHAAPWYYYFGEFPSGFFPWVLFLPGALVLAWRARRDGSTPGIRPTVFPLAWFAAGFVLFSLSSGKRGAYLLPLYPAAALLVGRLWDRALEVGSRLRWVGVPMALLSGAAALIALALAVVPRRLIPGRMVHTLVPEPSWQRAVAVLLVLAGASLVWWLWRRGRPAAAFAALVVVQATVLLAVAMVRAPQYEAEYPVRALAARVHAAVPPDRPLLSLLYDYDNIVAFYVDRPILPLPGPSELLAARAPAAPRFGLIDNDDLALLAHPGIRPLAEGRLGPKRILLIRLE